MLIGETQAAGFDQPLYLLAACHRRVESFCALLEKLEQHIRCMGVDEEAMVAIKRIYHYFDGPAVQHHADEEQDLLPLLLRRSRDPSQSALIGEWIRRIKREHEEQAVVWMDLRAELQELLNRKSDRLFAVSRFVTMERAHVRFEDDNVFPLGRMLLPTDRNALSQAMARRRGVPYQEDVSDDSV